MARKRGFFAELNHQSKVAERERLAAQRRRATAARQTTAQLTAQARLEAAQAKAAEAHARRQAAEHAQAIRAHEQQQAAALRAAEMQRKALEREEAEARVAMRVAEVESLNEELQAYYEELDGLLAATLDVDDYVDLETLRIRAVHPPFPREDLRNPLAPPAPLVEPAPPQRQIVEVPKAMFGRKKKHEEAQAAADAQFNHMYAQWQNYVSSLPYLREQQQAEYNKAERIRQSTFHAEWQHYQRECEAREAEAASQNADLDELISGLAYGTPDSVKEYVDIVLKNSIYPDALSVKHEGTFEPSTSELVMRVSIPNPESIRDVKGYSYVKSRDEITETKLTQKAIKDRYSSIANQVALRTLHEIFEADRRKFIGAISLELGTGILNAATGRPDFVPLIAVATGREQFEEINLEAVVPEATLKHLGAAVSKNPHGLTPVAVGGVRKI